MYKCSKCGTVIDELPSCNELRIEGSCETVFLWDCGCGGTYEEAIRCPICKDIYTESEMYLSCCDKCIQDNSDFNTVLKIAKTEQPKQTVKINAFLLEHFGGIEKVERALFSLIELANGDYDSIEAFINSDRYWYSEALVRFKNEVQR